MVTFPAGLYLAYTVQFGNNMHVYVRICFKPARVSQDGPRHYMLQAFQL